MIHNCLMLNQSWLIRSIVLYEVKMNIKNFFSRNKHKLLISLVALLYPVRDCYISVCPEGMMCLQGFSCGDHLLIKLVYKSIIEFNTRFFGYLVRGVIYYLITFLILSFI